MDDYRIDDDDPLADEIRNVIATAEAVAVTAAAAAEMQRCIDELREANRKATVASKQLHPSTMAPRPQNPSRRDRCAGTTRSGSLCWAVPAPGGRYCSLHEPAEAAPPAPSPERDGVAASLAPLIVGVVLVGAAAVLLWLTWEVIVQAIIATVAFVLAIVIVAFNTILLAKIARWLVRR